MGQSTLFETLEEAGAMLVLRILSAGHQDQEVPSDWGLGFRA